MSITWIKAVWSSPEPRGAARLCLVALADYANDAGVCWPSQPTLATRCAVSERAVRDTLARLEADGFVSVNRTRRAHSYALRPEALTPEAHCRYQDASTPEAGCRSTPEVSRTTPEADCRSYRKPTAAQPSENHQREPPTEPGGSVGPVEGEGLNALVSRVVSILRDGSEAGMASKVQALAASYGQALVSQQLDGLEGQYAGKPFGFGALRGAVENPERYAFQGRVSVELTERETYTDAEKRKAVEAGAPAEHFQNRGDDSRGLPVWMYLPHGARKVYAAETPQDAADGAPLPNLPTDAPSAAARSTEPQSGQPEHFRNLFQLPPRP